MKKGIYAVIVVVLIIAGVGGYMAMKKSDGNEFIVGNNTKLPTLTFYTTGLATTPQLAFWHAVEKGEILDKCNIRVKMWKNLDDLRGILLSGKGDLWLGHTDGFVQAAFRGAPVQLLVTTGWRKFYLVSTNSAIKGFADFNSKSLAFAPQGSPAVPVLRSIAKKDTKDIIFQSHEPRQLAMKLVRGDLDSALVPEPLVTTLLHKVKGLKVVASVEDAYGRQTDHLPRMPIAGIAVNADTVKKYPELIKHIYKEILSHGKSLKYLPDMGINALPKQFETFVPKAFIKESLTRDLIMVEPSNMIRDEIMDYLAIIHSHAPGKGFGDISEKKAVPPGLFWK